MWPAGSSPSACATPTLVVASAGASATSALALAASQALRSTSRVPGRCRARRASARAARSVVAVVMTARHRSPRASGCVRSGFSRCQLRGHPESCPGVDRHVEEDELRELGLGEALRGGVVDLVGDAVVADLGHLLHQGERRALALVEQVAGLAPARDDVQPLGPLAARDCVAAVHVHATRRGFALPPRGYGQLVPAGPPWRPAVCPWFGGVL